MTVRVRFAPSPTGSLHIGSARTALYNWLYARHFGADGTYVLRIEDTDELRSTSEHVGQALRVFRWLGLTWDEGPEVGGPYEPYFQSERVALYARRSRELVEAGHAYECYCTKDELDADKAAAEAAKRPNLYVGRCRDLDESERAARREAGREASIRFRVPTSGQTVVVDMIHGKKHFDNALMGDFIIVRSGGLPVYNFANVVDDADMHITHVIRGDDHLSNTPRQVVMYQALGLEPPVFAHAPMIVGPDRAKLSKRHGAVSVEELAAEGYIPETLRNGLALLGWSKDDETNVMTTDELVEHFDVGRVRTSPAAFDRDKLRWLNGQHLRLLTPAQFALEYQAWRERWLLPDDPNYDASLACTPEQAAYLCQEKVEVLSQVPALVGFLDEPHHISGEAWERLVKVDEAPKVLDAVIAALADVQDGDGLAGRIELALRTLCDEMELKPRVVFGPVRFAITGRTVTPGLFESMAVLGRERTLDRLRAARVRLETVGA